MPLLIECACGKKLKVPDELAGKKLKCPGCAKVLTAAAPRPSPPPVPLDDVEEETAVTVPKPPPPAWAGKPKRKPVDEEDDDDDEENASVPFWLFPGTLSTEVMALAPDGIWFASLKKGTP